MLADLATSWHWPSSEVHPGMKVTVSVSIIGNGNGIAILTQQMQIAPIVLYTMATADGATGVHLLGLGRHDA